MVFHRITGRIRHQEVHCRRTELHPCAPEIEPQQKTGAAVGIVKAPAEQVKKNRGRQTPDYPQLYGERQHLIQVKKQVIQRHAGKGDDLQGKSVQPL